MLLLLHVFVHCHALCLCMLLCVSYVVPVVVLPFLRSPVSMWWMMERREGRERQCLQRHAYGHDMRHGAEHIYMDTTWCRVGIDVPSPSLAPHLRALLSSCCVCCVLGPFCMRFCTVFLAYGKWKSISHRDPAARCVTRSMLPTSVLDLVCAWTWAYHGAACAWSGVTRRVRQQCGVCSHTKSSCSRSDT